MDHLEHLKIKKEVFFNFMNENYTLFKYSNIFFRDVQYAIMSYFKTIEHPVSYATAGKLANGFIENLVRSSHLTQIDYKSWRVNFDVGIKKKEVESEGVENE